MCALGRRRDILTSQRALKVLARIARGVLLAAAGLVAMGLVARQVRLVDRWFVFFPERELVGTPADLGLAFDDVSFQSADGVRLHGWFIPGTNPVTWVWFHGNAGNISHRLDNIALLRQHTGFNILIFDYRGYGRSEGGPSERGIYLDAEAALAYVRGRPEVDPDALVVFGRSLGAAVAVEMATRHLVRAVVLESPFTSVLSMARRHYPLVPAGLLVTSRFDSLSKVGSIRAPVMVVHGSEDDIVPVEDVRRLYDAAPEPKRLLLLPGAGHNDTYVRGGAAYFTALSDFVTGAAR